MATGLYLLVGVALLVTARTLATTGRRAAAPPVGPVRRHSWLYDAYMRSALWRLRRWSWWATSDRCCERCGCELALHRNDWQGRQVLTVHHKTYRRLGRERRSDVVLCCWPCHRVLQRRSTHR